LALEQSGADEQLQCCSQTTARLGDWQSGSVFPENWQNPAAEQASHLGRAGSPRSQRQVRSSWAAHNVLAVSGGSQSDEDFGMYLVGSGDWSFRWG